MFARDEERFVLVWPNEEASESGYLQACDVLRQLRQVAHQEICFATAQGFQIGGADLAEIDPHLGAASLQAFEPAGEEAVQHHRLRVDV